MEQAILDACGGTPLEEVESLTLDSKCKSASVVGLEKCVKLEELSANNCGITSLEGFPSLPILTKLELSDNRISGGLAALKNLPSLVELSVAGNAIGSVDELLALKDAPLVVLDLVGCPCSDDSQEYRDKVFGMFPSLQALDGKDKDGEELELGSDDDDDDDEEDFDEEESDDEDDDEDEDETRTRTRTTNRSKSPTTRKKKKKKKRATTTTMSPVSRLWSARPSTTTPRRRISKPSPIPSRRISTTKRMTTTTRARRRNRGRSETPKGKGFYDSRAADDESDAARRVRLTETDAARSASTLCKTHSARVSVTQQRSTVCSYIFARRFGRARGSATARTRRVALRVPTRHSTDAPRTQRSGSAYHHGGAVRAGTRRAPGDARAQDDARLRAFRRAVRRGDRARRFRLRAR
jgi:hypothetical protein